MNNSKIQVTAHVQNLNGNHNLVYICDETSQPYVNLAQLLIIFPNVDGRTVRRRLQGVSLSSLKTAVVQTAGGLQGVALYSAEIVSDLAFEFDLSLAKLMASAGAAVYLYGLAGYQIKPELKPEPYDIPQTYSAALLEAGRLALENEQLKSQIEADKDDTAFGKAISHTSTNLTVGEFGKTLTTPIGRNTLFAVLRDIGFIMQKPSTVAYQSHIDNGNAEVIIKITDLGSGKTRQDVVTLITPKGEAWIIKKIGKQTVLNEKSEKVQIQMESAVPALIG
jgi:phage antirepressor YoqD-like protein